MTAGGVRQRTWSQITEGDVLPTFTELLDVERVVASATATRTFFGGHIDLEYARSQGRSHIYMATGPIVGLLDRFVTDWAGPLSFLRKRSVKMVDSLYAGATIRIDGTVNRKWLESGRGRQQHLFEVGLTIANDAGKVCVTATSVFEVPAE